MIQVVTLAVHMYLASCLMGHQFIEGKHATTGDVYFPVFTFLQFFFYLGWLKVILMFLHPQYYVYDIFIDIIIRDISLLTLLCVRYLC